MLSSRTCATSSVDQFNAGAAPFNKQLGTIVAEPPSIEVRRPVLSGRKDRCGVPAGIGGVLEAPVHSALTGVIDSGCMERPDNLIRPLDVDTGTGRLMRVIDMHHGPKCAGNEAGMRRESEKSPHQTPASDRPRAAKQVPATQEVDDGGDFEVLFDNAEHTGYSPCN